MYRRSIHVYESCRFFCGEGGGVVGGASPTFMGGGGITEQNTEYLLDSFQFSHYTL